MTKIAGSGSEAWIRGSRSGSTPNVMDPRHWFQQSLFQLNKDYEVKKVEMLWVIFSSWYTRVLREAARPRPNSGCEEMRPLLRILNNFKVRYLLTKTIRDSMLILCWSPSHKLAVRLMGKPKQHLHPMHPIIQCCGSRFDPWTRIQDPE
jgi:hypothetical protein